MRFTFGILGEHQVDRTLADIEDNVADWSPAFEVLTDRFLNLEARQFRTQGGYSGGWTPLSPKYAAWKARQPQGAGKGILRFTDELMKSLTEGPQIKIVGPRTLILGTANPKAAWHHHGEGRLPVRRVVDLPEVERVEWIKVLQSHAVTGGQTGVRAVQ